jgi:Tol biopolymer transport system component
MRTFVIAGLGLSLVASLFALPAAATDHNRAMVYTRAAGAQSSSVDIFTLSPDGKQQTRLTTDGRSENAVVSPNGRWIAFSRTFKGQADLMIMRRDGKRVKRVTRTTGVSEHPTSWSSDNKRIVFTRLAKTNRGSGVYRIDRDGSATKKMLPHQFSQAHWSPASRQLVALRTIRKSTSTHYQVVRTNLNGSNVRALTTAKQTSLEPRWSPDGTQIAYQQWLTGNWTAGRIRVMNADGSNKRVLADTGGEDYFPTWSPDGKWVAFWGSATGQYPSSIFKVAVDNPRNEIRLRAGFARGLSW